MAKVRVIPSTINPLTQTNIGAAVKRRVAAYARVSTDSDEQYTSYEAQVNFYSKYIQEKPEWEFVQVYADEGITGTNTKKRNEFNKMIADALEGKIDLIITKSISRFARNTLDTISITRDLKASGIEVFFEKENLWTLDPKSELILTIMASIAQEESRSISQNVTLGKRWGFQEGKVSFAYSTFLGYKKVDDKIVIDEAQAQVVKAIYRMYLVEGKTATGIAVYLQGEGIKTPSGKSTRWTKNTVTSILTNEKYKGDALLQKKFTDNYLEHSMVKNNGEVPQYYVENSHPAIIDRETWEQVQVEIRRRNALGYQYSATNVFATKLICDDCGGFYGQKKWHSTDRYSKFMFQCNNKYKKGKPKCITPSLHEDDIKQKFIRAFNITIQDKNRLIEDTNAIIEILTNTEDLDLEIANMVSEMEIVNGLVQKLVSQNAKKSQSQEEYSKKYDELVSRYDKAKTKYDDLCLEKVDKQGQLLKLKAFIGNFIDRDTTLESWDSDIWMLMVESAIVYRNNSIKFKFHNGEEIIVE